MLCVTAIFLPPISAQLWKPLENAATSRIVALAADPRNDSTIYLAAPGGGIWKSQDSGLYRWLPVFDSSYSVQVCSLVLDPSSPDVIYAGTGDDQSPRPAQGVARSSDGGQTWTTSVRFTNKPVCALAVDPANGARVLAGSSEGLFLSMDSASHWRKVLSYPVTAVSFDGEGNIYAGQLGPDRPGARDNVLLRSVDGGLNWTSISLPASLTVGKTNWVSILARSNSLSVAVSYQVNESSGSVLDFYRSTDSGAMWNMVPEIGAAAPPAKIFADPSGNILHVSGKTLLVSQDQGNTWKAIGSATTQIHDGIFTVGLLLLAGENGLESLLPGREPKPTGTVLPFIPLGRFFGVALDSSNRPWAAGPAGVFGPNNLGVFGQPAGSLAASTTGSNIYAAGNSAVFVSTNGGTAFSSTAVIAAGELRAAYPPLVIDPNNGAIAYVAGQRVYRTANTGTSWTALPMFNPDSTHVVIALAISPVSRQTLYVATACVPELLVGICSNFSIIWRSSNSGQTWTRISAVPGLVNQLKGDPLQTNTVYAAIGAFPAGASTSAGYAPGDLLRSTDGGASWTSVMGNLPRVPINSIAIDPTSVPVAPAPIPGPGGGGIIFFPPGQNPRQQPAQTIYVGTDLGVFVSFNAGTQWTAINSGLPPTPITQLALRQPGATLMAATFGRGIYQASVMGLSASLIANPLSLNLTLSQNASKSSPVLLANVSSSAANWKLTSLDSWLTVPQTDGTLQPATSAVVLPTVSAAALAVGTHLGRLQIANGTLAQNIALTLQVTVPPAAITISSGDNASAVVGTTIPPLVVSVLDANGAPVPGLPVSFAIASGGGSLGGTTSTTDAGGKASTVLTLPNSPATVRVTATYGSLSTTFTATAALVVAPTLMANSVVNGVTFTLAAPPSPGSIISIFGENLAQSSAYAGDYPLPTSLQGTRVLLAAQGSEMEVPLFYVSPRQVNALVPTDTPAGAYKLRVTVNSVPSNSVDVSIVPFSPGIFTTGGGSDQGIFLKTDGSLVSVSNAASPGSVITLFATGLGAVDPPLEAGAPASFDEPLNRTIQIPRLFFDRFEGQVLYSGLAPGFAGVYQLNVVVPANVAPAANVSVSLSIGGVTSKGVAVSVQP
ncbi:MAG: hypothetical protein HYX72_07430 [Acidobacteria bacterium]|nr:hypothetical protein [Acidobacteriota bacterium]